MANTGYKKYNNLLKVVNGGINNGQALDINNQLISISGLAQDTKANTFGQPDYIPPVLDIFACPIPNSTPTFSFNGDWQFSDTGAQNNTITRSYTQSTLPVAALWSVNNGSYGLRINWENSLNCGGLNDKTQAGSATVGITVNTEQKLGINWTGLAELQSSGFENMTISIDNIQIGSATSAGGNLGCVMGDIVSTNLYPNGYPLTVGIHTITITAGTGDQFFHTGSYYAFTFTKIN